VPRLATLALLQILTLVVAGGALALLLVGRGQPPDAGAARARELASKLKAAGALEESAAQYQRWLETDSGEPAARAKIAYSLGTLFVEQGQYEKALRWFYEADLLGAGDLESEVGAKIVFCLERLGRVEAARAALAAHTSLEEPETTKRAGSEVVLAKIGSREISAADAQRALDDLPPELQQHFASRDQRLAFLKKLVADELISGKAAKLELDRDPEVRRRLEGFFKQLVVSTFIEREILGKVSVAEEDLKNHFAANKDRFKPRDAKREPTFEEVRQAVEQDYRMMKIQAAYNELLERELSAEGVVLYPERLEQWK
jgi:tetratricopeptide (TPR) repeat protein